MIRTYSKCRDAREGLSNGRIRAAGIATARSRLIMMRKDRHQKRKRTALPFRPPNPSHPKWVRNRDAPASLLVSPHAIERYRVRFADEVDPRSDDEIELHLRALFADSVEVGSKKDEQGRIATLHRPNAEIDVQFLVRPERNPTVQNRRVLVTVLWTPYRATRMDVHSLVEKAE